MSKSGLCNHMGKKKLVSSIASFLNWVFAFRYGEKKLVE